MADVLAHNERAAAIWSSGGRDYDRISESISDALLHVISRLDPKPVDNILDVATGTGWTARLLAGRGAKVTGVDIGQGVIDAAKALSTGIEFRVADAEALPFVDASFDSVVSTFGVMFAGRPKDAGAELARVCKSGGQLGLVTWLPESTVAGLFGVMRPYMPPPPAEAPSPFQWGRPEFVKELLADAFDLRFETGTTYLRMPDGEAAWELFIAGYGPTKALAAGLDALQRERLRADFVAFHEQYRGELGLTMPREYLIAIGRRK